MLFTTRHSFFLFAVTVIAPASLIAQESFPPEFIAEALQRAKSAPDHRVTIELNAPIDVVFDTLLMRLADYSDDVKSVAFEQTGATPQPIGVGSERITVLESDKTLVQRLVEFDPPRTFAYFTDMQKSEADLPIDYSIGQYELTEQDDGTVRAQISVVLQPSSALTGFVVRRVFNRAMDRDFKRAAAFLNQN